MVYGFGELMGMIERKHMAYDGLYVLRWEIGIFEHKNATPREGDSKYVRHNEMKSQERKLTTKVKDYGNSLEGFRRKISRLNNRFI